VTGHAARMVRPAVAPPSFLPPPANVLRARALAERIARALGAPLDAVTVRTRPAGPLGCRTVAFATRTDRADASALRPGSAGLELRASSPSDGELEAYDDLERKIFGA